MTFDDAVELIQKWPQDRSIPRRLAEGIATAPEEQAQSIGLLVEALTTAAASEADYVLIDRYFD